MLFGICVVMIRLLFPQWEWDKYAQDGLIELFSKHKIQAIIAAVIFAPVVEEFMFRTLVAPKPKELLLFLSSWSLMIITYFYVPPVDWYFKFLITGLIILLLYFIYPFILSSSILDKASKFLNHHVILVLQLTSVIFGLMHISNYVDGIAMDSVLFLLIVPRIIAGHMFGKLKIENNHIIWPILLHAINNGVVVALLSTRL